MTQNATGSDALRILQSAISYLATRPDAAILESVARVNAARVARGLAPLSDAAVARLLSGAAAARS